MPSEQLAAVRSLASVLSGDLSNEPVPRLPGDPPGRTHLVAGIIVRHATTGRFLVQRRARARDRFPGHFTDSASGHVPAREGLDLDGVKVEMARELAEEMGVECAPDRMQLWTIFHDPQLDEIKFMFVTCIDDDTLHLDPVEVDPASGWFQPGTLATMLDHDPFVPSTTGLWRVAIEESGRFGAFLSSLDPWQRYWTMFSDLAEARDDRMTVPFHAFLGRFQPVHRGHVQCIAAIASRGAPVVTCVGSAQYAGTNRNPLPFNDRRAMIKEVLQDEGIDTGGALVIPVPDVHCEHVWMHNVAEILGRGRFTLHTNNDWVRGLATDASIPLGPRLAFDVESLNGTRVRRIIREGGSWGDLVPRACKTYIERNGLVPAF